MRTNFAIALFSASIGLVFMANTGCELPFEDIGGMCLYIDPLEQGSWYDMRLLCSRMAVGGNLVKITNADQLRSIIGRIDEFGLDHSNYWTSGSDEDLEGNWKYMDGTAVPRGAPFWRYECNGTFSLRPFQDTEANCVALDRETHYRMADFSCLAEEAQLPFSPICQDTSA